MKPLKSGIEMDPKELKDSKGGSCSCGCDIYVVSTGGSAIGEVGGTCYCDCNPDPLSSMWESAAGYL